MSSTNFIVSFFRKFLVPYKLSTGQIIPQSAMIAIPAGPMAVSSEYHSSPKDFDGLRFHRVRQSRNTDLSGAHQFTATSLGQLMFGHGKCACPGRFYADIQSKIIVSQIMMRYDLKLMEGDKRPENISFADAALPDRTRKILFKTRERPGSS